VGHPAVAAFARLAEGNVNPTRKIAGQNTLISRTIHDMTYDAIHDELIVPSFYAQGILTFRGDANGDVAPVRKIFGPKAQLQMTEAVGIDAVNGEIVVAQYGRVLVFPREANGDVAPIRILEGPNTGLAGGQAGRAHVDPVNNVLVARVNGGLGIFDRTASGNTRPLRVINGPGGMFTLYPPKGLIFAHGEGGGDRHEVGDSISVWSVHDSGHAPPRFVIGSKVFYDIRGIAFDPEHKLVMATDKNLNALVTFHVPEVFDDAPTSPQSR
jgi:hypothetical protein